MPIRKKTPAKKAAPKKAAPLGPKAKLMKLQVTTLRNKAKKLGVSDVTKRTKENLVQSIILGEARKKRGTAAGKKATAKRKAPARSLNPNRQTNVPAKGSDRYWADASRKAKAPGRRTSASGNVYYERRANRSDKPGQLMGGSKRDYIKDIGDYIINNYFKYDENYDFGDAFNETIDSYEVYYNKQWKVVYDLGYYDWSDNDLGIIPTDVGQVMYCALYELYGDVESYVEDNK
jgi:sporulation protein YlmC with PRC-barrel domain